MLGMIKQAQKMNTRVESLSFNSAGPSPPLYYALKWLLYRIEQIVKSYQK